MLLLAVNVKIKTVIILNAYIKIICKKQMKNFGGEVH